MAPRKFSARSLDTRFKDKQDDPKKSDAFLLRQANIPNWELFTFFDGESPRKAAIEGFLDRQQPPARPLDLQNPISLGTRMYYDQFRQGLDTHTALEFLVEASFIDNPDNLRRFVTKDTMPLLKASRQMLLDEFLKANPEKPMMLTGENYRAEHPQHAVQIYCREPHMNLATYLALEHHDTLEDTRFGEEKNDTPAQRIAHGGIALYRLWMEQVGNDKKFSNEFSVAAAAVERMTLNVKYGYDANLMDLNTYDTPGSARQLTRGIDDLVRGGIITANVSKVIEKISSGTKLEGMSTHWRLKFLGKCMMTAIAAAHCRATHADEEDLPALNSAIGLLGAETYRRLKGQTGHLLKLMSFAKSMPSFYRKQTKQKAINDFNRRVTQENWLETFDYNETLYQLFSLVYAKVDKQGQVSPMMRQPGESNDQARLRLFWTASNLFNTVPEYDLQTFSSKGIFQDYFKGMNKQERAHEQERLNKLHDIIAGVKHGSLALATRYDHTFRPGRGFE